MNGKRKGPRDDKNFICTHACAQAVLGNPRKSKHHKQGSLALGVQSSRLRHHLNQGLSRSWRCSRRNSSSLEMAAWASLSSTSVTLEVAAWASLSPCNCLVSPAEASASSDPRGSLETRESLARVLSRLSEGRPCCKNEHTWVIGLCTWMGECKPRGVYRETYF